MKHKIKKWHIVLMSFFTLFVTIFASLFSLRADTVDEETGEIVTDNWELGVVFYDSSVDAGKTPLTEINWDASDGGYQAGTPRVITVQINYKNNSAVTTYQPEELTISIPNLIHEIEDNNYPGGESNLSFSVIIGANDATHTGYDWNFVSKNYSSLSGYEFFNFTNANTIEEKANFEGSIQIIYTLTPRWDQPEHYENECLHEHSKKLQATLMKTGDTIGTEIKFSNTEHTITSPNWPNNYNNNMAIASNYWEYTSTNLENLSIYFDKTSKTESNCDKIYIYDKTGLKYTLSGTQMAGKIYNIEGNYIKIAMYSDYSSVHKGFKAYIGNGELKEEIVIPNGTVFSNEIQFEYTRTYIHPWKYKEYFLTKTAEKIKSYDGLADNASDYIWVKYLFKNPSSGILTESYPYIYVDYKNIEIHDNFPEECVVYGYKGNLLTPTNNTYIITEDQMSTEYTTYTIYVGYPKSIYNEKNNNLLITNTADMYGYYSDNLTEIKHLDSASVELNLADFEFNYSGNLYGLYKGKAGDLMYYQDIVYDYTYNLTLWKIFPDVKFNGEPLTVKIGDDILYATDQNNNYVKLQDNEYHFTSISFPLLHNGNGVPITKGKYIFELWVRYANSNEYILYEEFENQGKSWTFNEENPVVSFYFILNDLTESIVPLKGSSAIYDYGCIRATTKFSKQDIPQTGNLYNFAYMQVFKKDNNNNLILQNEPSLENYANFITKEEIATYDLETYGSYMQRYCSNNIWKYYVITEIETFMSSYKNTDNKIIQNDEEQMFTGSFEIGAAVYANVPVKEQYFNNYPSNNYFNGYVFYDLLPKGMEISSTIEEMKNSIKLLGGYKHNLRPENKINTKVYNSNKQILTTQEFLNLIKENMKIEVKENWNNTNRTYIKVIVDLSKNPLLVSDNNYSAKVGMCITYNYKISYDSFIEYGNVYTNRVYAGFYEPTEKHKIDTTWGTKVYDDGSKDEFEKDLNENNSFTDEFELSSASTTITSAISTHQDVTTYVKTDQSNYSTGIVNTSNSSEYEYKLRVRTGSSDITNLIIYTSIEEAQPKRTRWKGEFLGVDTTYAENKGYTVKVWYSENTTIGTLSEDTSWKEYNDSVDKTKVKSLAFQYLVETENSSNMSYDAIDPAVLPANSLTYVLIKMKSPADESLTTLARMDCWTQWNAIDEFDQPVDFITGINSNVVRVALPNSVDEDNLPSITLNFKKEIQGTDSEFENMKLDKAAQQLFMIRLTDLTANEDGSHNQITALLKSDQKLIISRIPIGTYLLEELGDNYFDFVDFTNNNNPEIVIDGVTFEKTDQGYIITVSEDLAQNVEFNIKVINEIEDNRFYKDKEYRENLFLKNRIEEEPESPV